MRVIHRFDFKGKNVVKGINFEGLRPIANIEKILRAWGKLEIKEIHFQGATTSLHNTLLDYEIVKITKNILSMPITVGGGIKSIEIAKKLITHGADRIAINTGFFLDKNLLKKAINELGESTIVVSIDVSKQNGKYFCFINNGRDNTGVILEDRLNELQAIGNPEILITNIERDGLCLGIDPTLVNLLKKYKGPVVLSGGIHSKGDVNYFRETLKNESNGLSIGRAFHNYILSQGIEKGEGLPFASKFELTDNMSTNTKMISPKEIEPLLEAKNECIARIT